MSGGFNDWDLDKKTFNFHRDAYEIDSDFHQWVFEIDEDLTSRTY